MRLDGKSAWNAAATASMSRWSDDLERLTDEAVSLAVTAKFRLTAQDSVFCLGSCFARNVEEHLIFSGLPVLSKRIVAPKHEWRARPNGIVNKFTTHSMLNEVAFVLANAASDVDETWFTPSENGWRDLQLIGHDTPVSLDRAVQRRRYLISDYFSRLRQASVVVLTLGLNEVWHDAGQGRFLNTAPSLWSVRRDPKRYALHVTSAEDNVAVLNELIASLRMLNPGVRVVVSVSPVPMETTFTGRDVFVANTHSKAVLRAAADEVARAHDYVDYFPSYEMITLAPRSLAYASDGLHVRYAAVSRVIDLFLKHYAPDVRSARPDGFSEDGYLAANPDVEDAVRAGIWESGYEHWLAQGAREQRALMPPDGPTERMRRQGWV